MPVGTSSERERERERPTVAVVLASKSGARELAGIPIAGAGERRATAMPRAP
jgi:hypothetical protein